MSARAEAPSATAQTYKVVTMVVAIRRSVLLEMQEKLMGKKAPKLRKVRFGNGRLMTDYISLTTVNIENCGPRHTTLNRLVAGSIPASSTNILRATALEDPTQRSASSINH